MNIFQSNLRLKPSILTSFVLLTVPVFFTIIAVTYLSNDRIARTNARELVNDAWRRWEHPSAEEEVKSREVHWPGTGFEPTRIYRSEHLGGETIEGPAVIESTYSTMLVERGQTATGDDHGNIILRFGAGSREPATTAAASRREG